MSKGTRQVIGMVSAKLRHIASLDSSEGARDGILCYRVTKLGDIAEALRIAEDIENWIGWTIVIRF